MKELQSGQSAIFEESNSVCLTLSDHGKSFSEFKTRLEKIQSECSSFNTLQVDMKKLQVGTADCASQVSLLSAQTNDAENRSRRNHLFLFGISDTPKES